MEERREEEVGLMTMSMSTGIVRVVQNALKAPILAVQSQSINVSFAVPSSNLPQQSSFHPRPYAAGVSRHSVLSRGHGELYHAFDQT